MIKLKSMLRMLQEVELHRLGAYRVSERPLLVTCSIMVLLIFIGTIGFSLIEDWSLLDSFYMTVITLSTVGFREVEPLSPGGKIFVSILIVAGVGIAAYALSAIVRLIIEGELARIRGRQKMDKLINTLSDHTIVCGFGQLGSIVTRELLDARQTVVVVEQDLDGLKALERLEIPFVEGSAYEDEVLESAGIRTAQSLISLLPKDSDNVYVTLCARDLNPEIRIITRTNDISGESRLRRAGANHILAPYRVAGSRIVQQLIRPHVSDFLEVASGKSDAKLVLEEIIVPPNSPLGGTTLEDADLRRKTGAIVAAFIEPDGQMILAPGGNSIITPGATMIVFGEKNALDKLSEILLTE